MVECKFRFKSFVSVECLICLFFFLFWGTAVYSLSVFILGWQTRMVLRSLLFNIISMMRAEVTTTFQLNLHNSFRYIKRPYCGCRWQMNEKYKILYEFDTISIYPSVSYNYGFIYLKQIEIS